MPNYVHRSALLLCCAGLIALLGCESDPDEGGSGFPIGGGGGAAGGGAGGAGGAGAVGGVSGVGGAGAVGGVSGASGAGGLGGMSGGVGGVTAGTGGMTGGAGGMTGGAGGMTVGAGGMTGGTGGMTGGSGGTSGTAGDGMSVSGIPDAELETLRQVCVDEINMYRATLSLPPMDRGTPQHELCSDQGAKKDGDSGDAHSSAGRGNPCATSGDFNPRFGSQNTCPGYQVGGFGSPTIADALKGCLEQMWDEGEPPGGEEACIEAYFNGDTACFLAHGHYINMKGDSQGVSCGFYKMENGRYWMNQDFY